MEEMNYNGHNAIELAERIANGGAALRNPQKKCKNRAERIIYTVERWLAAHPRAAGDADGRRVLKHLYIALAYMGDNDACALMEMLAYREKNAAKVANDEEAFQRAEEDLAFWQNVSSLVVNKVKAQAVEAAREILFGSSSSGSGEAPHE